MTTLIELKEIAKKEIDKSTYFILGTITLLPDGTHKINVTNSALSDGACQAIVSHILKSLSLNLNRN